MRVSVYKSLHTRRMLTQGQFFKVFFYWFEFWVFLLLDQIFDQWDQHITVLLKEMYGLQGGLCWKVTLIWSYSMRVSGSVYELGVMVMKEYSTLLRSPELEPYHQMWFSSLLWTPLFGEVLSFHRGYSQCILNLIDLAIW